MNAKRTVFGASRPSRFLFAALFLTLLAGLAPQAQASLGDALALRSLLSAAQVQASPRAGVSPAGYRNLPNGRTVIDHRLLKSGAIRRANATTANTVPIPNPTQTFDINNPLPAFEPLIGYGSPTAINNDPSNSALFIPSLTPTNLHPVWSADQTFIVFSSNRTLTGGVQPDGRFHIWAIAAAGGEAYQITGTSQSGGAGEFFPALSANNTKLAFVSDDQTPNTTNLFVLGASVAGVPAAGGFSFNALVAYNNGQGTANPPYLIDVSSNDPSQNGIVPLTYRSTVSQADSSAQTGFSMVQRPTFSPGNDGLIVFSAFSTNGFNQGHYHLYFLYTNSLGFDPNNNFSFPGKLTDGPADDRDPAWSQDNQFIAFSSTANAVANNPNNSFGPNPPTAVQDQNQSQSLTTVAPGTTINTARSLFLISGGGSNTASGFGVVPNQLAGAANGSGRITAAGTDNFGPAWSYVTLSARNQYINPAPGFQYLAFARGASQPVPHDIYYLQTVQTTSAPANPDTIVAEGTTVAGAPNAVVKLNTDDASNTYNDIYPTWSPFLSVFSIAYTSNRTVTYNDPATTFPSEVAVSVARGGTAKTSDPNLPNQTYTVGAAYTGIFQSQVLNLDPPTLLRFAPDQVLHIQAAGTLDGSNQSTDPVNGTSNKLAVTGSQFVTITTRLSNREAGIDDNKVFLQIKDPDSKYQDARGLEHKVFSRDFQFAGQTSQPVSEATTSHTGDGGTPLNPVSFGLTFGGIGPFGYELGPNVRNGGSYGYPSYTGTTPPVTYVETNVPISPRGTHGGHWAFPNANNPLNTYIYVGKGNNNNNNQNDNNPYPIAVPSAGGDPRQFIPVGPEYECQFINPQFSQNLTLADASVTDYRSPFYLAGADDQQAFSGQARPPRPIANTTDTNGNVTAPAEYLKMNRVPANLQDNKGGVLYSVTWKTPASPSDFYLDVIAYDKAVFPALPANTSQYIGQKFNWRIYDNVGGFSTQQTLPNNNDVLVVADYPLGQKFAATTFGGQNVNQNLIPKQFGTESYLTDVDVSILPDRVYAGAPDAPLTYNFYPVLNPFLGSGLATHYSGLQPQTYPGGVRHQNGLGVGSYYDSAIDDNGRDSTTTPGVPFVTSQKYTIWRILSRGPVPDTLLQSYQPAVTAQPAVADAAAGGAGTVAAQNVLDAHRCVIWLAPYTGSLLVDPGTLDDLDLTGVPNVNNRVRTQQALRNFVQNGGRLCITGQDVGSTLTLGGTSANAAGGFLPDVLNASFNPAQTGTTTLTTNNTDNRIFGNALFDGSLGGSNGGVQYLSLTGAIPGTFKVVNVGNGGTFPYQDRLRLTSNDQNDGAFDEIPANRLPTGASIQGQPDTLNALNGATVGANYDNGGIALVFHDDPFGKPGAGGVAGQLPNGGTGSRTVYAAFNLGALSQDYFSSDAPNPASSPSPTIIPDLYVPDVIPRNVRSAVVHNIVSYLRTGFIKGKITQTAAGNGQNANSGVPGATVYVQDINGQTPSSRQVFSATTSQSGDFTISGVEPGTYRVIAYKSGYTRAISNGNVSFTVEGDTTASNATLTINPVPPGNVKGLVQDTAKKPIIGATVTITSQDNTVTRTTTTFDGTQAGQPTGGFLLSAVPVTTYTVATANGPVNDQNRNQYTPAPKADTPYDASIVVQSGVTTGDGSTAGGPPVTFTLAPIGATVNGRVYSGTNDATGGGLVAGGAVQAFASAAAAADPAATPLATATIGPDGTYSLKNILPVASFPGTATTVYIKASAPGFTPQTFTQALYLGDVITDQINPGTDVALVAIQPGKLTGTVTLTTGGGPVANATVSFTAPGSATPITATTNASGSYTIDAAPAGTYSATAVGPNNPHGSPTTTAATPSTVTVTSGATTTKNFVVTLISPTYAGTVTDAATGSPLANALITFTDANTGGPIGSTLTGADGTFTTAGSIALDNGGEYTVTASLAGYQSVIATSPFTPGSTKIILYNGDTLTNQNFTLTQLAPGTVSGTVTDNTGAVVPGATVTLTSTDKTTVRTAVTDGNGAYALPMNGVPAGSYTATVVGPNNANGKPKYTSPPAQTVNVTSSTPTSAPTPVNFTLTQILPTFAVTVTDATSTAAITNATVTFTPAAGGAAVTVTTNAAGVYTSPGLAPGTYTVTASAPGFFDGAASATVDLGDTGTPLALALNQKGSVYGLVTDSVSGAVLSGVTLTVTNTTGGTAVTTTPATITTGTTTSAGPDGALQNFTFSLPPGTYTLTATKANYAQSTSPVFTVGNATPVRVNLALTSSLGTLGGLVSNAGSATPVGGATVTVTDTAGKVVTTFTTSASASTGPDAAALNYTGQVLSGTYNLTVTLGTRKTASRQVVVKGGVFTRADFSGTTGLPALYTFTAGLKFFSTPYDYSGLGFDGLFGARNTAPTGTTPNGNRSSVAVWSPTQSQYLLDPTAPADTIRLGQGYWVFLKNDVPVTQQGTTPPSGFVPQPLNPTWNMIGVPNVSGVPVSSLMFDNGAGGKITFAQASSTQYAILTPNVTNIYRYDAPSNTYQAVGNAEVLQPWQAYWIRVRVPATLEIPTGTP